MDPKITLALWAAKTFLGSDAGKKALNDARKNGMNFAQADVDDILNDKSVGSNIDKGKLRDTMLGTPEDYIINAAGAATQGVTSYLGSRAMNNANALATALLEGNRDHTPQQDAIYGYSPIDKANKVKAAEAIKEGQNKKAGMDAISKVVGKLAGDYERDNALYKTMLAADMLNDSGMPGTGYNFLNGIRSSADKSRGGF